MKPVVDPQTSLRRVSDARTIRALAHPVRIALIELLSIEGPMTATQASERIGESPTTCSFHLRQLARYGFVEEAGTGPGRNRPWKMTTIGMTAAPSESDGEADTALTLLRRLFRERYLGRLQTWDDTRPRYPQEWRDAGNESQFVMFATPTEARAVSQEVFSIMMRYRDRLTQPELRPEGALPVEGLFFLYPLRLPRADRPGPAGDQTGPQDDPG
ncbi:MAG TPA: helix-turn-helix domain-containing protein [Candidatus Dormibacteraeota bacterium]